MCRRSIRLDRAKARTIQGFTRSKAPHDPRVPRVRQTGATLVFPWRPARGCGSGSNCVPSPAGIAHASSHHLRPARRSRRKTDFDTGRPEASLYPRSGDQTAFHPRFRINPDFVDVTALPLTAAECADALANEAAASAGEREGSPFTSTSTAVAPAITPRAIPGSAYRAFSIRKRWRTFSPSGSESSSRPMGDELSSMYNNGRGQLVPFLEAGDIKVVMFSGGGNEFLQNGSRTRSMCSTPHTQDLRMRPIIPPLSL